MSSSDKYRCAFSWWSYHLARLYLRHIFVVQPMINLELVYVLILYPQTFWAVYVLGPTLRNQNMLPIGWQDACTCTPTPSTHSPRQIQALASTHQTTTLLLHGPKHHKHISWWKVNVYRDPTICLLCRLGDGSKLSNHQMISKWKCHYSLPAMDSPVALNALAWSSGNGWLKDFSLFSVKRGWLCLMKTWAGIKTYTSICSSQDLSPNGDIYLYMFVISFEFTDLDI